ncbi:LysR family transcriptional regulator [Xylophilus rhododendri]|uniref:LysR family transcriptional regulator n=1 Tax=Xylophilus rhododendri TaxID=2697032 RepID=A0A857JB67_9BURK|nr:LysR family transcriptional regulator [Xylophilus rhododendri]QHJ00454.1 LysR family transcriptional regulator [Xylophilus rhododendri]
MNINWTAHELEVLLVLVETLSFRQTAQRMHLSQPAVSGTVARLEAMLSARLFERSTRSVQLTEAGQVFAEQARFMRHQMQEAVNRVRAVSDAQVGRVALAALPSLAATVVPLAFARFARDHPAVQLELVDRLAGSAFEMVRAGRVDFALTAANPAYADLDYIALSSDAVGLLLPAGHKLARGKTALAWSDIAELPHISMPAGTSVRQYADAAFLAHKLRFAPRFEVEYLATIAAMVAAGVGVSALPELAARVAGNAGVVWRRLRSPEVRRPIGLVSARNRAFSPAALRMIDCLKEEMRVSGV